MGPGMPHPPHLDGEAEPGPADAERGWFALARQTADGHVIQFGLGQVPWRSRPRAIGWFTVVLLTLLTLVAYGVVRHWLRPLRDIGAGALRYGQGDFAGPIPVRRPDELGELAAQINTMASRLHGMLDAKRALLLAISHELRSPLTRARLNAELVDEGASRDALLRDLGEMRDLISDLLESERLAAGHQALQREPTDLAALVRGVCAELEPTVAYEGDGVVSRISLRVDDSIGLVDVDPMRWRVLVRNLVSNALRHGRPEGAQGAAAEADIEVQLIRQETSLSLSVRDHGPGVPPEQLARLTEAFYRPDSDRGRRSGGVGLGLHLCRLIAEAHGGTLRLEAARPGLSATLVWPAGLS
jgi:signal transduction histidine kinase